MRDYAQITDLMERKILFLEDTKDFYNSNNRAVIINALFDRCTFSATENSPGCAVGRHLSSELANYMDARGLPIKLFIKEFPNWMQEMSHIFLGQIQRFHDDHRNWNELGLSETGLADYYRIREQILQGII